MSNTSTLPAAHAQQRTHYTPDDVKDGLVFTVSGGTGLKYRTSLRTGNSIFVRTVAGNDTGRFYSCAYIAKQINDGAFVLC